MTRVFCENLEREFVRLHENSNALLRVVPADKLYWQPSAAAASCGENILRGAAAVEQVSGGISVNLWDDPFEWTLPESLGTTERVAAYLDEVEAARRRAFASIHDDRDLGKTIMPPAGVAATLFAVLLEALARAAHHQGRATAVLSLIAPPIRSSPVV